MRYLIVLEPCEEGFAVQVPDLAISTYGASLQEARQAACSAILGNLEAYSETGLSIPNPIPSEQHLGNPDFVDSLFTYVEVPGSLDAVAA